MLRIAVCDDNNKELESINWLIIEYINQHPENDISVVYFQSAYNLIDSICNQNSRFDIYLLDIIMPNINGIKIGEFIRNRDDTSLIIYITSSPDFAIQSYSVQAFYYLMKPFTKKELFSILDKALKKIDAEISQVLLVKTKSGISPVKFHNLMYAESKAHCFFYHLSDGEIVKSVTLRESFHTVVSPLLNDSRFIKISVSFVVNMGYVKAVNGSSFLMADDIELSISRSIYTEVKKQYIDFLLQRGRL